jgi:hypothetical protein
LSVDFLAAISRTIFLRRFLDADKGNGVIGECRQKDGWGGLVEFGLFMDRPPEFLEEGLLTLKT